MELQSGLPLLIQQFRALMKKNWLLSWRNKRSTFLQLFSSLFFILLIFCIQKAIDKRLSTTTSYKNVFDPETLLSPPIPRCEDKFEVKLPCFDFVWSGNGSPRIRSIVSRIMANNPGRPIQSSKVKSFGTPDEVDAWLLSNPMHCPGALHFVDRNSTVLSYGIQTNSTSVTKRGKAEDLTFKFQVPLQIAAEREIARTVLGDPNFSWDVGLKEFAHPAINTFTAIAVVGPTFFLAIAMFCFEFQVTALVTEKELKLRQAMSMMGLYESAYWFSWLVWQALMNLLSSLFIVLFGMMFHFNFFLHNSFALLFLLFFLFQLAMTAFAFTISTFISKSSTTTVVGFFTFIIGFLTQLVTLIGFPYDKRFSKSYRAIWSLFPPNLLSKALELLSDATATPEDEGISWRRRTECTSSDSDCVIAMDDILRWLVLTFFLWFLLAIYFDNINPNSSGVRKSLFYFLSPGYWSGKGGSKVEEGGVCSCTRSYVPPENTSSEDEDVLEEENVVKQQIAENEVDPNVAVQIRGLAKTYPGTRSIGCCKCRTTSPYHAVTGLWVNFEKDQLFCLLGPNGAGKTTVINCLTGITPSTGGDALIYGYSIRSYVGMLNIQKIIGVCPQFDILWDVLSGQEHLHLFASIKGLPSSSLKSVAEKSLEEVKLSEAAKMRTSSYSGGMKRRLSFAIALIGDPKLVILDEPTTGMDPITRRHVWDLIENAKRGRAIVLTTHSMEEADILGDRIAIMAKGKLRCIGSSIRLKSRFGTGFVANISFHGSNPGMSPAYEDTVATTEAHHVAVKQFFREHLHVEPKEENKAFITFVIPHEKEALLPRFFEELQKRETEFGISDVQLGLTTLEEVFLNIAKKAELESALSEGSMVTLNLTSGISLEIPRGARFIGIPGTEAFENPRGMMVEVYWEQDETGSLCISGHSDEIPVPVHAQSMSSMINRAPGTVLGRTRRIHGIVIDPDHVEAPNY